MSLYSFKVAAIPKWSRSEGKLLLWLSSHFVLTLLSVLISEHIFTLTPFAELASNWGPIGWGVGFVTELVLILAKQFDEDLFLRVAPSIFFLPAWIFRRLYRRILRRYGGTSARKLQWRRHHRHAEAKLRLFVGIILCPGCSDAKRGNCEMKNAAKRDMRPAVNDRCQPHLGYLC